jgi:hypothetical protein
MRFALIEDDERTRIGRNPLDHAPTLSMHRVGLALSEV